MGDTVKRRRAAGALARRAIAGIAVAAAALACGGEPPEQRLAEAGERLEESREQVRGLEREVEEKRAAVEQAAEELASARAELARAEEQLAEARNRIDARATEVALFRAVQGSLLDAEALRGVAVRVSVSRDVVTLRGDVESASQAEVAIETARETPGVSRVVNELEVRGQES